MASFLCRPAGAQPAGGFWVSTSGILPAGSTALLCSSVPPSETCRLFFSLLWKQVDGTAWMFSFILRLSGIKELGKQGYAPAQGQRNLLQGLTLHRLLRFALPWNLHGVDGFVPSRGISSAWWQALLPAAAQLLPAPLRIPGGLPGTRWCAYKPATCWDKTGSAVGSVLGQMLSSPRSPPVLGRVTVVFEVAEPPGRG